MAQIQPTGRVHWHYGRICVCGDPPGAVFKKGEPTGWSPLGRFAVGRTSTTKERVRETLVRYINELHYPEFFTLTLRTIHGPLKECPNPKCDGVNVRGQSQCRTSGVQRTHDLVGAFLQLIDGAVIVEEFGERGRRHFHGLGIGGEEVKVRPELCFPCLAGFVHTNHKYGSAFGFWRKYAGFVDSTFTAKPTKAAEYITKTIDYTVKDQYDDDEQRYALAVDADGKPVEREGRIWIKQRDGKELDESSLGDGR